MTYKEYVKTLAKGPMALTIYILFSSLVFIQFISLFLGRWIDLVENGANIFMVVILWMLFAKCISKENKNKKPIVTCTFIWTIIKLVSLGIDIIGIIIAAIYTCVKSGDTYSKGMMIAGGIILLIVGLAVYVMRVLICIKAMGECINIKNNWGMEYVLKNNWFVMMVIAAALRGGSMILQILYAALAGSGMGMLHYGIFDLGIWGYSTDGSKFAGIIDGAIGIGSNVMVILIDLLYIAIFVLLAVIMSKYRKTVNR